MATNPFPMSRLDTLPAEVPHTIFNYAFSGQFMDIEEDGNPCVSIKDRGNPQDYHRAVFGLNANPLNSPLVRRLALEELHRITYLDMPHAGDRGYKKAMAAISARAATLRADPELGRSVRRLTLNLNYDDNNGVKNYEFYGDIALDGKDHGDDEKAAKKMKKRVARFEAAHKALFKRLPHKRRPPMYGPAGAWAQKAVCTLDLLTSAIQVPELGIIPAEDGDVHAHPGQALPRLQRLHLREQMLGWETGVLDTHGALLRFAPHLDFLEISCINQVVSSSPTPNASPSLPDLTTLQFGLCTLSAASMKTLLAAVGPRLKDMAILLSRRTCRPSDPNPKWNMARGRSRGRALMLTTYDLLAALAPWQATSLTELCVYRGIQVAAQNDQDEDEDRDIRHRNGPSASALLAGFTAMRHLAIGIDLLDWRTAYNTRGRASRAVADVIVAQLPPNLETLRIAPAMHEERTRYEYDAYWMEADPDDGHKFAGRGCWPRRQALAQSLLAVTRAGHFPYQTSIRLVPNESTTRTITLAALCAEKLLAMDERDTSTLIPPPRPKQSGPPAGEISEDESEGQGEGEYSDAEEQPPSLEELWSQVDDVDGEPRMPLSLLLSLAPTLLPPGEAEELLAMARASGLRHFERESW